jgi:CBS domain-containing protein
MARHIKDVMQTNPVTLSAASLVMEAARAMRDADVGDVIVTEHDQIYGIVTDRDLVVRALAEGADWATVKLGDICSRELTVLAPTDTVETAVELMREKAIRRLPVVQNGTAVGIVSLGDLALVQDPNAALSDISAAPPNI